MPAHPFILALLSAASLTLAQQPEPHNGALDYWRAGTLANKPRPAGDETAISRLSWEAIGPNLDPAKMPPEFEAARKEIEPEAITQFIRAGAAPACDFHPHVEDGWKMLLPELAMMRNLARMARVDARVKLMEGDAAGATERLIAMYRAATNAAHEDVLISTLVGAAISKNANDEAKVLSGSGKLADADRQRLLEAVRSLKNDGLRFHSALEGERRITSGWLKKEYAGPGAPARFVRDFADMSKESPEAERKKAEQVAKLTPEAFAEAASKMDTYYADMLRAWDGPNAADALAALDAKVDKGDYGPVARIIAPAMRPARKAYDRATTDIASTEEALSKKP